MPKDSGGLLTALDVAGRPEDMNAAGSGLHPLKGNLHGHWSVTVSGNWRMTFAFEGRCGSGRLPGLSLNDYR
jgi:plasmid maintenance system killer protein